MHNIINFFYTKESSHECNLHTIPLVLSPVSPSSHSAPYSPSDHQVLEIFLPDYFSVQVDRSFKVYKKPRSIQR